MADQIFLQIPATVWWGVRQIMLKTPRQKFDEKTLAASLNVQIAASRQYLAELKKAGLLDDDGRTTDLAGRWRLDETYPQAVEELASANYPEELIAHAPPGDADRQWVVNWFKLQGLGEGSAKNKAATYLLITSATPNASPIAPAKSDSKKPAKTKGKASAVTAPAAPSRTDTADRSVSDSKSEGGLMPLNVNVQIHISADASKDQIDNIFSAMKKYLRND